MAKAITKKPVAKKAAPAAKKAVAKKASTRKPNAAFMAPKQPDDVLGAIVGNKPISRPEIVKKLWAYIKKNGLQDKTDKKMINADAAMKVFFDGKDQVSMFEMNKKVSLHITDAK